MTESKNYDGLSIEILGHTDKAVIASLEKRNAGLKDALNVLMGRNIDRIRQCADLQTANSGLLERARNAERLAEESTKRYDQFTNFALDGHLWDVILVPATVPGQPTKKAYSLRGFRTPPERRDESALRMQTSRVTNAVVFDEEPVIYARTVDGELYAIHTYAAASEQPTPTTRL